MEGKLILLSFIKTELSTQPNELFRHYFQELEKRSFWLVFSICKAPMLDSFFPAFLPGMYHSYLETLPTSCVRLAGYHL
jgi:hypothetical protein